MDILSSSFVFIDILGSFVKIQLSATPFRLAQTPDVWGLRSPAGTGYSKGGNLHGLRLWRNADVQKQRLRQPATF